MELLILGLAVGLLGAKGKPIVKAATKAALKVRAGIEEARQQIRDAVEEGAYEHRQDREAKP